ncbi:hypothetical protein FF38_03236 [Lucilia cuprina]|uniref:Uncharacterized protein n=1 Tax=Lucilia cuprina TaxID=7375 RepID=A0A0L0BRK4_LUCCU|nr:hypothetical protein FF38_03236 [Lucilia cuprina]
MAGGFGTVALCCCTCLAGLWKRARLDVSRDGPGLTMSLRNKRLRAEELGVLRYTYLRRVLRFLADEVCVGLNKLVGLVELLEAPSIVVDCFAASSFMSSMKLNISFFFDNTALTISNCGIVTEGGGKIPAKHLRIRLNISRSRRQLSLNNSVGQLKELSAKLQVTRAGWDSFNTVACSGIVLRFCARSSYSTVSSGSCSGSSSSSASSSSSSSSSSPKRSGDFSLLYFFNIKDSENCCEVLSEVSIKLDKRLLATV